MRDLNGLAIDEEDEILARQAADRPALPVGDHDVDVDERRLDAVDEAANLGLDLGRKAAQDRDQNQSERAPGEASARACAPG